MPVQEKFIQENQKKIHYLIWMWFMLIFKSYH